MPPASNRLRRDRSTPPRLRVSPGSNRSGRRRASPETRGGASARRRPPHRRNRSGSRTFFFLSRQRPLDAAWMDPAPEPLLDPARQIRRSQGCVFGPQLLDECHHLRVEFVGSAGTGLPRHERSHTAVVEQNLRLIKRRTRKTERLRAVTDRLSVHLNLAHHLVLDL